MGNLGFSDYVIKGLGDSVHNHLITQSLNHSIAHHSSLIPHH